MVEGNVCTNRADPNASTERLAFLFHIRQVPGLNLGPESGYTDWG
jgi:hypothetical protein